MSRGNPLLTGAPSLEAMLANVAADIVQPRPEQTDTWTSLAETSLYEFLRPSWSPPGNSYPAGTWAAWPNTCRHSSNCKSAT
jgi:hypothetical protein